ncbi:MAG: hypothetical protein HYR74_04825 [Candidatus Eisenbacteria bacterium]|nr:hypothetical protein [Candidatus Eisenbacteria bacterium]
MLVPRSAFATALLGLLLASAAPSFAQNVTTFASGYNVARGLLADGNGNLYLSQRFTTGQIVRFTPPSNVPTFIASGFTDIIEMALDDAGNLYASDYGANKIWKITPAHVKSDFAHVFAPAPMTRDAAGNLYVGDYSNLHAYKITPAGDTATYAIMPGTTAHNRLAALRMTSDGTLYMGSEEGTVYAVGPGGAPITTFATGLPRLLSLQTDFSGGWFAATYDFNTIVRIFPDGSHATFAGTGVAGLVNGPLLTSRFNAPTGLAIVGGTLYIADETNDAVRAIDLGLTNTATSTWGRLKALYR